VLLVEHALTVVVGLGEDVDVVTALGEARGEADAEVRRAVDVRRERVADDQDAERSFVAGIGTGGG
jgi:hypothetical protein